MVTKLFLLASLIGVFVTELTTAMFFTTSKENDYPRIGKRPIALLGKKHKTWERDSRFDIPGLRQQMTDDIEDMLNFHGSEEWILRREEPERNLDYEEFMMDFWPKYRDSRKYRSSNLAKRK